MKRVGIFYASRRGQTRRIVSAVVNGLATHGVAAEAIELLSRSEWPGLDGYQAAIVASPVYAGHYAGRVVSFAKAGREALEKMPNAFVSVSLSQAGVQRTDASAQQHAKFVADVEGLNMRFVQQTGWRPNEIENVAGALLYTQYDWLVRFVMRRIARASGGSTDITQDHFYTDWAALERFCARFVGRLDAQAPGAAVSPASNPGA